MRVTIADDDPVARAYLARTLVRWGYEPVLAGDGDEATAILLGEDPPPLALLDWMMPGRDGPDVVRALRHAGREPYTFIILLTSLAETEHLVDGLEAGADEFLTKPVSPRELELRLRTGRRIVELQRSLIEAREHLRSQAMRDPLTGLHNRRALREELERGLARSSRAGGDFAVLMVDLDHFKAINDRFGHAAGDEVLVEVARRMSGLVRAGDQVGRFGGEEFLVLLPGADVAAAMSVGSRIRAGIAAAPVASARVPIPVTCSVGIATAGLVGSTDPEVITHHADLALYRSKAAGRDRVTLATTSSEEGPVALP